ncbi:MAG: NADP-dependent phosphogluconate dehydrogenase [Actinomycetota bacterium]|nr:NADP-dependent phosphogluconate dehydrogenase [Actinomycetota bacterium]
MGGSLARNIASHDIPVAVYNRSTARTEELLHDHGHEGPLVAATSPEELAAVLARPRCVMLMVSAGAATDAVLGTLADHLEPGDVLLDGGNAHFRDTRRREHALSERGLGFLGTGVSGGEEGALRGPSIMPGGAPEAYETVAPVLETIAARVDGTPCCAHLGPDGAGHYTKMVHNGIEYADMQLIAESYDLLRHAAGLGAGELAGVYDEWNTGDLESFLIEVTAAVLRRTDPATGGPLVDAILDEAEQKGTGGWTVQHAVELGTPVTAIAEAVFARAVSAAKAERIAAARVLTGPAPGAGAGGDRLVDDVREALYAAKVVAYAQGFAQLAAASDHFDWSVPPGLVATIWRGGCIIRARLLDRVKSAYEARPGLGSLLLDDYFREVLSRSQDAWRRVVGLAVERGVPVPALSSTLAYYDGYRRERLPANLLQAQRDYFGAHRYRRVDTAGVFHTRWHGDGAQVRLGDG